MDIGSIVEYEGKYYKIIDKVKATCENCSWFYMLDGLNYFVCESKLKGM